MTLFTDGGSRYLAIGRTPHKLGVYILDDGNSRPLRMTFPGRSRFPAWLPTYFPLGALPLDRGCRRRRSLDGKGRVFESPSIHPSRTRARSTLRPVQHRPREASYKIFQPLHRRGTRKQCRFEKDAQPERSGEGLSNCVSILRFRKSARACKAIHRPCEQSTPQSDPEGHEGNAVGIKHLEAGAAAPRLEYVTAVSDLAGDRELRLLNQDRQKINRLLTHF